MPHDYHCPVCFGEEGFFHDPECYKTDLVKAPPKRTKTQRVARWKRITHYAEEHGRPAAARKFELGQERIRQIMRLYKNYLNRKHIGV